MLRRPSLCSCSSATDEERVVVLLLICWLLLLLQRNDDDGTEAMPASMSARILLVSERKHR